MNGEVGGASGKVLRFAVITINAIGKAEAVELRRLIAMETFGRDK